MSKFEVIDQLVESGRGYVRTADVTDAGVSKHTLADYAQKKNLQKVAHGVYMSEAAWQDDYYILSLRNKKIVFSFESALLLHKMTDREPFHMTVTVPIGYNADHLSKQGVAVKHVKREWHRIGVMQVLTNLGNPVPVYDKERTICDLIRNRKDIEIQTYQTAIREYMRSGDKNLHHLAEYAKAFRITEEVKRYTEVML